MSDPQPALNAGDVTDGRVTWGKKIINAALDTQVWPMDGDVRGSTDGQCDLGAFGVGGSTDVRCEHCGEPPRLLGMAKVLSIQSTLNLNKETKERHVVPQLQGTVPLLERGGAPV